MSDKLDRLLRTTDAAGRLGVHIMTIYRMVREGSIIPVRIGKSKRSLRFRESDIERLISPHEDGIGKAGQ